MKYRIATLAALAAAITTLSACGSSSSQSSTRTPASSGATATAHNAADVTFATDMIPHHSQAVEMADMALSKATNVDVKTLAAQIMSAQDPEIKTMTGWLKSWGQTVPSTSTSMGGMDTPGSAMGMMSATDMSTLDKTTGVSFDRMWVKMMITHHQGAVDMSKTELATGQYGAAKTLAQSIITSQTAQITKLQSLATKLA